MQEAAEKPTQRNPNRPKSSSHSQQWTLFIDGSANKNGFGIEVVLKSPEGLIIEQEIQLRFEAFNNKVKYETLVVSLKNAKLLGVENIVIHYDSQLVANQLTGEYAARNEGIGTYVKPTHKLFKGFFLEYIEGFPEQTTTTLMLCLPCLQPWGQS